MIEQTRREIHSRELAVRLYDVWIRERQHRGDFQFADGKSIVEEHRTHNFAAQTAKPRQKHLEQLREVGKEMSTADKVALLVMMELPALEASTLLHRLSVQVLDRPDATYFDKLNQLANCGCGCG